MQASSSNNPKSRHINKEYKDGVEYPIYIAFDTILNQNVIIRESVSDSQIQKAREIQALADRSLARLIGYVRSPDGILVYGCPGSKVERLLSDQRCYSDSEIMQFAEAMLNLMRSLLAHRLLLSHVQSEDILMVDPAFPLLINHDNIVPYTLKEARLNRAPADIGRLIMQMALGCSYEEIRHYVELQDGRYFLKSLPPGLNSRIAHTIKCLFSYQETPRHTTNTMLPVSRVHSHRPSRRQTISLVKRSIAVGGVVCALGGAVYAVKTHFDERARIEESARTEAQRRERERRELEEAQRREEARKRALCLAAIQYSKAGDCRGQDLTGIDAENADLRNIALDNANLTGANLKNANLSHVELSNVDLTNASLRSADLSSTKAIDAIWKGADLREATVAHANLENADFSHAQLGEIDLTEANISNANFSGTNLSNQTLTNVKADGTNFQNANLKGVTIFGGRYSNVNFSDANLSSASFVGGVQIDESQFSGVIAASARFDGATVHSSLFYQADMLGVVIENSEFSGTSFVGSRLEGSQFRESVVVGGSFANVNLRDVIGVNTLFRTMNFEDARLSGAQFFDCDFYRAAYFEAGWGTTLRNVVLPDGSVKNPATSSTTEK